ncbi:MAG: ornithine cyclodeaminase [Caldilineae bacterium]|nr:MAG: ornithine cyclodeaminase [Caldilineae bacterium]
MPIWLTREDVQAVLNMPDAINAVAEAFRLLSLGQVELPLRTNMPVTPHQGSLLTMPAYVGGDVDGLGVKLITLYAENPQRHNLPAIQGSFALFDPRTGALEAVMEAGYMTAVRTGAAGGVAVRHLARPDVETLLLFGAGAQAPYQLEAVLCERPGIRQVWVVSRTRAHAEAFARAMQERFGVAATVPAIVEEAVRAADIIVTATSAHEPLFDGRWLQPGVHITGVGSHLPHAREVDSVTVQRAKVVADQTQACLAEAGDLVVPLAAGEIEQEHIYGELGEIVAGRKPGRVDPAEITFFKSVGLAVQDVAVARLIVDRARDAGVGQTLTI